MEKTNRRQWLTQVGKLGIVGGLGALAGQNGCAPPSELPFPFGPNTQADETPADENPAWPYPYAKLDPEAVRKGGHKAFYEGDCCYGAFASIVDALKEAVGAPFTRIPTDMMRFGKGGVYGYGTLCGSLNGAAAAIQLVCDESKASKVVTELLNWYAATPLPTDVANQYAVNHEYLVQQLKTDAALPQNTAGEVLCHVSVSKWCKLSGFASASEQRKERCARLTGDVAAKAVTLLNDVHDAVFSPVLKSPGEQTSCMLCHKAGTDYAAGNVTQGKMNCTACHVEPTIPPIETHPWQAWD